MGSIFYIRKDHPGNVHCRGRGGGFVWIVHFYFVQAPCARDQKIIKHQTELKFGKTQTQKYSTK